MPAFDNQDFNTTINPVASDSRLAFSNQFAELLSRAASEHLPHVNDDVMVASSAGDSLSDTSTVQKAAPPPEYQLVGSGPNREFWLDVPGMSSAQLLQAHQEWLHSSPNNSLGAMIQNGYLLGSVKPESAGGPSDAEALSQLGSLQRFVQARASGGAYLDLRPRLPVVITMGLEEGYGTGRIRQASEIMDLVNRWMERTGISAVVEGSQLSYRSDQNGAPAVFTEPSLRITLPQSTPGELALDLASQLGKELGQKRFYLERPNTLGQRLVEIFQTADSIRPQEGPRPGEINPPTERPATPRSGIGNGDDVDPFRIETNPFESGRQDMPRIDRPVAAMMATRMVEISLPGGVVARVASADLPKFLDRVEREFKTEDIPKFLDELANDKSRSEEERRQARVEKERFEQLSPEVKEECKVEFFRSMRTNFGITVETRETDQASSGRVMRVLNLAGVVGVGILAAELLRLWLNKEKSSPSNRVDVRFTSQ